LETWKKRQCQKTNPAVERRLLKLRHCPELVDSFRQCLEQEKQKPLRENRLFEDARMNEHERAEAQSSKLTEELLSEHVKVRILAQ
jgi:hypothetical protein